MLIVEDQAAMRKALEDFVRSRFPSCNIAAAADGNEALALFETHRPHVVLMDIQLGDVSGIDLTATMKSIAPETAVIMVTAMSDLVYKERAERAGAFAYVVKSRLHVDLVPAITQALSLRRPDPASEGA